MREVQSKEAVGGSEKRKEAIGKSTKVLVVSQAELAKQQGDFLYDRYRDEVVSQRSGHQAVEYIVDKKKAVMKLVPDAAGGKKMTITNFATGIVVWDDGEAWTHPLDLVITDADECVEKAVSPARVVASVHRCDVAMCGPEPLRQRSITVPQRAYVRLHM